MTSLFTLVFSNIWIAGLCVGVVLLVAAEAGFRGGRGLQSAGDEARKKPLGGIQGAVLGLMGLLLGFTFSMAMEHYNSRRDLMQSESNAIGTAWLRAGFLEQAEAVRGRSLLLDYAQARIRLNEALDDQSAASSVRSQGDAIQRDLWRIAEKMCHTQRDTVSLSFATALNDVFDLSAERLTLERSQVPAGVWRLLLLVAVAGCFICSYAAGAEGVRTAFTAGVLPLLFTTVIVLILDLTRQQQGLIHISQQPLLDVIETMKTGL